MTFKDHFSGHADRYTRFRPHYPRKLFEWLAGRSPTRKLAWDCGTGNGQAAVALAEFFDEVVGTDPSVQQIAHAQPHAHVRYLASVAENCPLAAGSVDLVTVAQALHWFDFDRFYAEVRRVCRPEGVLAVWAYALAMISPEVDAVVHRLYEDVLGTYWSGERRLVEQGYSTIDFPFPRLDTPEFVMTAQWSYDDLVGYLDTWSSAQNYRRQHGSDPLDLVREDLLRAWGSIDERRTVRWPLHVKAGRVNG